MKRVAWLTDLHLEFVWYEDEKQRLRALFEELRSLAPDYILIGGDTAVADSLERTMENLAAEFPVPIYFVLGNHDCYYGAIGDARNTSARLSEAYDKLHWLTDAGVVPLSERTALIGHDSWADGRLGNGNQSSVLLNDYRCIKDFECLRPKERFELMNQLGDAAAKYVEEHLIKALKNYTEVIFLTHAPPFREACWHDGQISEDDFLPHFTCKAVGDVLRAIMEEHANCNLTVLCGHTHGTGCAEILPNLVVKTGGAEYGHPKLQGIIELS